MSLIATPWVQKKIDRASGARYDQWNANPERALKRIHHQVWGGVALVGMAWAGLLAVLALNLPLWLPVGLGVLSLVVAPFAASRLGLYTPSDEHCRHFFTRFHALQGQALLQCEMDFYRGIVDPETVSHRQVAWLLERGRRGELSTPNEHDRVE